VYHGIPATSGEPLARSLAGAMRWNAEATVLAGRTTADRRQIGREALERRRSRRGRVVAQSLAGMMRSSGRGKRAAVQA
jgi:hypothetical protein